MYVCTYVFLIAENKNNSVVVVAVIFIYKI